MSKPKCIVVRFKAVGENGAIRLCIGASVDEIKISRIAEYCFLNVGCCEIGIPPEILNKLMEFTQELSSHSQADSQN